MTSRGVFLILLAVAACDGGSAAMQLGGSGPDSAMAASGGTGGAFSEDAGVMGGAGGSAAGGALGAGGSGGDVMPGSGGESQAGGTAGTAAAGMMGGPGGNGGAAGAGGAKAYPICPQQPAGVRFDACLGNANRQLFLDGYRCFKCTGSPARPVAYAICRIEDPELPTMCLYDCGLCK